MANPKAYSKQGDDPFTPSLDRPDVFKGCDGQTVMPCRRGRDAEEAVLDLCLFY